MQYDGDASLPFSSILSAFLTAYLENENWSFQTWISYGSVSVDLTWREKKSRDLLLLS